MVAWEFFISSGRASNQIFNSVQIWNHQFRCAVIESNNNPRRAQVRMPENFIELNISSFIWGPAVINLNLLVEMFSGYPTICENPRTSSQSLSLSPKVSTLASRFHFFLKNQNFRKVQKRYIFFESWTTVSALGSKQHWHQYNTVCSPALLFLSSLLLLPTFSSRA